MPVMGNTIGLSRTLARWLHLDDRQHTHDYEDHLRPEFKEIHDLIIRRDLDGLKAHQKFIDENINAPIDTEYNTSLLAAVIMHANISVLSYFLGRPNIDVNTGSRTFTVLELALLRYKQNNTLADKKVCAGLISHGAIVREHSNLIPIASDDSLGNLFRSLQAFEHASFTNEKDKCPDIIVDYYQTIYGSREAYPERWKNYKNDKNDFSKILKNSGQLYEPCYEKFAKEHDEKVLLIAMSKPNDDTSPEMIYKANMALARFYLGAARYSLEHSMGRVTIRNHLESAKKFFITAHEISQAYPIEIELADKALLVAIATSNKYSLHQIMALGAAKEISADARTLLKLYGHAMSWDVEALANYFLGTSNTQWRSALVDGLKSLFGIHQEKNIKNAIEIFDGITKNTNSDTDIRLWAYFYAMYAHYEILRQNPEPTDKLIAISHIKYNAACLQQALKRYEKLELSTQTFHLLVDSINIIESSSDKATLLDIYLEFYLSTRTVINKKRIFYILLNSNLVLEPEFMDKLINALHKDAQETKWLNIMEFSLRKMQELIYFMDRDENCEELASQKLLAQTKIINMYSSYESKLDENTIVQAIKNIEDVFAVMTENDNGTLRPEKHYYKKIADLAEEPADKERLYYMAMKSGHVKAALASAEQMRKENEIDGAINCYFQALINSANQNNLNLNLISENVKAFIGNTYLTVEQKARADKIIEICKLLSTPDLDSMLEVKLEILKQDKENGFLPREVADKYIESLYPHFCEDETFMAIVKYHIDSRTEIFFNHIPLPQQMRLAVQQTNEVITSQPVASESYYNPTAYSLQPMNLSYLSVAQQPFLLPSAPLPVTPAMSSSGQIFSSLMPSANNSFRGDGVITSVSRASVKAEHTEVAEFKKPDAVAASVATSPHSLNAKPAKVPVKKPEQAAKPQRALQYA